MNEQQGMLFPDAWEYRVVINCRDTHYACTVDEAWSIIGKQPFGSGHVVYTKDGSVADEFVPY